MKATMVDGLVKLENITKNCCFFIMWTLPLSAMMIVLYCQVNSAEEHSLVLKLDCSLYKAVMMDLGRVLAPAN